MRGVPERAYPFRHHRNGEWGEWQGHYLPEGTRSPTGYETDETWVRMCPMHKTYWPCLWCEGAALGTDEGAE